MYYVYLLCMFLVFLNVKRIFNLIIVNDIIYCRIYVFMEFLFFGVCFFFLWLLFLFLLLLLLFDFVIGKIIINEGFISYYLLNVLLKIFVFIFVI